MFKQKDLLLRYWLKMRLAGTSGQTLPDDIIGELMIWFTLGQPSRRD
jgi:hypothetical protein